MAQAARLARIILGFALIGLGIVGLFLPFLQGIAMIAAGLLLLAPEYRWARRLLDWARQKWGAARGARSQP
ncbi:MAG: PGPGW domain-containing protein [Terriglobia bacterium]